MKFIVFLVLFSFLIFSKGFSQIEGRIIYRVISERLSYDENNNKQQVFVEVMNKMSQIRDSIALHLDFKENQSIFYLDTKTNLGLSNLQGYKTIINSFNVFYRNDSQDTLIEVVNSDKTYLVTSKASIINWKITNEIKKIGIYRCIKAEGIIKTHSLNKGLHNKTIIAWFCPDISLKLGPKGYGGLPGLIMELEEGKLNYYVKVINFNLKDRISINKPSRGKIISREDYLEQMPTISRDNYREYFGN